MERFREHEKEFKTKAFSQKALMQGSGKGDSQNDYDDEDS